MQLTIKLYMMTSCGVYGMYDLLTISHTIFNPCIHPMLYKTCPTANRSSQVAQKSFVTSFSSFKLYMQMIHFSVLRIIDQTSHRTMHDVIILWHDVKPKHNVYIERRIKRRFIKGYSRDYHSVTDFVIFSTVKHILGHFNKTHILHRTISNL